VSVQWFIECRKVCVTVKYSPSPSLLSSSSFTPVYYILVFHCRPLDYVSIETCMDDIKNRNNKKGRRRKKKDFVLLLTLFGVY